MNGKYLSSLLFVIVSGLGSLYILLEAILQSFGKSICATEGCKVVGQVARYGDASMLAIGFGMMAVLFALSFRGLKTVHELREQAVDMLLVAAVAGEGFLTGYQLYHLNAFCLFCLSVLCIYLVLGILRLFSGRTAVLAGFLSLGAILSLLFLILPAGGTPLPVQDRLVLFYSPDCKHCTEIRREIEAQKLEVTHVKVMEHAATLKNLGIDKVPTLMVNGTYEKIFLTGTEAIRQYLASCRSAAHSPVQKKPGAAGTKAGKKAVQSAPPSLLPLAPPSDQLFNPAPDEGLCKEDVKCD